MCPPKPIFPDPRANWDELLARWIPRITIYSLILVLALTFFPFNFSIKNGFSFRDAILHFSIYSSVEDWIANILLFLPIGFGFTGLLQQKSLGKGTQFIIILVLGFCLTSTIELMQLFLPSRYPSLGDILANVTGDILGFFGYQQWRYCFLYWVSQLIQFSKR